MQWKLIAKGLPLLPFVGLIVECGLGLTECDLSLAECSLCFARSEIRQDDEVNLAGPEKVT